MVIIMTFRICEATLDDESVSFYFLFQTIVLPVQCRL